MSLLGGKNLDKIVASTAADSNPTSMPNVDGMPVSQSYDALTNANLMKSTMAIGKKYWRKPGADAIVPPDEANTLRDTGWDQ